MLTIEQDDFVVWVSFSNEVARKLKCHTASLREIWVYCLQKRICFTGNYTCYEFVSDYQLNFKNLLFGMPSLVGKMTAKRGELFVNEGGVTTMAAKVIDEESFINQFYFTPEQITGKILNNLGYEKIAYALPRIFYLINKMSYAKSIEMVKSGS